MEGSRLWLGCWLLVWVITSCHIPAASDRTAAPEGSPTMKIASPIREVVQRMHDDGVTPANVGTRSAAAYSNPLVRVDAEGRIHTDIALTQATPEVMAELQALQVQDIRGYPGQMTVQAWVPFDRLAAVAALPAVRQIRPPRYAMRR